MNPARIFVFLFIVLIISGSYFALNSDIDLSKEKLLPLAEVIRGFWRGEDYAQKLAAEVIVKQTSNSSSVIEEQEALANNLENAELSKNSKFLFRQGKTALPNFESPTVDFIKKVTTSLSQTSVDLKDASQLCHFETNEYPSRQVILNEIAWKGSPPYDKSNNFASDDEWIELKNISPNSVDLTGWQILSSDGKIKIILKGSVEPANFYLLERTDDNSVLGVRADQIYTGALSNSGAHLRLFDKNCKLVDEIKAFPWPAERATDWQTLERGRCLTNDDCSWFVSLVSGGTPRKENSSLSPTTQKLYTLAVVKSGSGDGTIIGDIDGINCGQKCAAQYPAQTKIILKALPSASASWNGWGGKEDCGNGNVCVVYLDRDLTLTANFSASFQLNASSTIENKKKTNHLVIAEIQITGGVNKSTNDFIRIYNPLNEPFNLKGYRLVKRTKTGSKDYLIKSWTVDAFIPPESYYSWVNSSFAPPFLVNSTTAASISEDNGIALRRGANDVGEIIDSVGWGAAQNTFVEGAAFLTNPAAGQILRRKFVDSQPQDTDNNAEDFELITI